MEKKVIELLGLVFRVLLRSWSRDTKVLGEDIVDAEQFAQQCGLSIWEAKKFNRSIEDFIDLMAEEFIKEVGTGIRDKERKKAIISQIQEDIRKIQINEGKLISELLEPEDFCNVIMAQSREERKMWGDDEIGVYTNCVRYISKASIEFLTKLPSFTPEALKVVIQRQNEYHKELYKILSDINSMTSLIKNVEIQYREYEEIYRQQLIRKYSKVEIIGSQLKERRVKKYDISLAYVELNCINDIDYEEEVEISHVFSYCNVVWIKGEAGSGKTTFLQWVTVCASKNDYQKIKNIRNTIPIVIELRNVKEPLNLQNIVNKVTEPYGNNSPMGWVSDLLKKKRVILLFDGLDEIPESRRKETYEFIENMVEEYPEIKVLLTARNSVNDEIECDSMIFEIMPMKIQNIKKFIWYWHRSVLRQDAIVDDREIKRLQQKLLFKITENQALKSLARNPLLCAMICALNFVNDEQLPNDKMELYDKCCEMLMDARDNQRNIDSSNYNNIPKLDYSKKRKILEEMAYWMMNGGVSSEKKNNVLSYLRHLLKDTNILPDKEKRYNIRALLDFFIERSGIIREPEEGIIDFVHKTFMEFLAVKAVCRNCAWNVLIKEACNVHWKETIIMCFREMGKDNIKYVLKEMVRKSKLEKDSRYIFIASLGASNAVFLADDEIKKEIDVQIKAMIPPEHNQIYEIAQAGTYLLPFLKDSGNYSDNEKNTCLDLLDYLETDEAIPVILSYISGNAGESVKVHALNILNGYTDLALEEYNVKERLVYILKQSIVGKSLVIYESMLPILDNRKLADEDIKIFEYIKSLKIVCGISENTECKGDFLGYFKQCKTVALVGDIQKLHFLKQFVNIKELQIISSGDLSEPIQILSDLGNLVSVKKLYIEANCLNYLCKNDLNYMKKIESFEIHCQDSGLELIFDDFDDFPMLNQIVIDVDDDLKEDMGRLITNWKKMKSGLKVRF